MDKMKYLDKVKLINDKNYVNLGLKCGRIGRIISAEIRDDEFYVNFIDENFYQHKDDKSWFEKHMKELKDDISIPIKIKDLELLEESDITDNDLLEAIPKNNPSWWCKVENGYIINFLGEKKQNTLQLQLLTHWTKVQIYLSNYKKRRDNIVSSFLFFVCSLLILLAIIHLLVKFYNNIFDVLTIKIKLVCIGEIILIFAYFCKHLFVFYYAEKFISTPTHNCRII